MIRRYKEIAGIWSCDSEHIKLEKDPEGAIIDSEGCEIAEARGMKIKDALKRITARLEQDEGYLKGNYHIILLMRHEDDQ